ncbi:MAG: CBS domain-containing protein, partial [Thermodesulfovibrionales bacterium]
LTVINWVLAGFNLLPAYPLDGGRVLRSALWYWRKDLRWATRIASQTGSVFGIGMIIMGIVNIMKGVVIGGVWWFIIGLFLRNASSMSYQQVLIRKSLQGEKVSRIMKKSPVTVPPSITIKELVEDYIYKFNYKMFPVLDGGRLIGCISTREVKEIPSEQWHRQRVEDYLLPCSHDNTVVPGMDAVDALSKMNQTGTSRLMVVENGVLVGIITLKDIMRFLSLRLDLETPDK